MKHTLPRLCLTVSFILCISLTARPDAIFRAGASVQSDSSILRDSVSVDFLKHHLRKKGPRLILTPDVQAQLKKSLKSDPVVGNVYKSIRLNADKIMQEPLLVYKKTGKRLLAVSREMLYRMNILGMTYVMEKDARSLDRINRELLAVCGFKDWNPSHFLDVAEMSMAVALALDWTQGKLPRSTQDLAQTALIEKGIKPSYGKGMGWIRGTNNWNQVCNGGMIAASLAVAGKDPALAARTITRSLRGMPYALKQYAPDGAYPEGATYWDYGTTFSALTASILESALGTDFGLSAYRPLMESADFRLLSVAPSGWYYNFSDCGDKRGAKGDMTLAWFAVKTGNGSYFEKQRFLMAPDSMGKLPRHAGAGLIWISQFENRQGDRKETTLPTVWKGDGPNPVVFFRSRDGDPRRFYVGAKGGRGSNSHGNMDAGSFIFELDGVRWVVDPGTQDYYEVEKTGFDLWGSCQQCDRWKLLTKNNFGHSTLSVNNRLFDVNGKAEITAFSAGAQPEATIDLTPVYDGRLDQVTRKLVMENNHSLLIRDDFTLTDSTKMITWQLMTTADVEIVKGGAVLHRGGKQLKLEILSRPELSVSVVSLDPPPLKIDRQIKGLKRIEIRCPAYLFSEKGKGSVGVRLSGPE
ncbi:heparinase II/III domain-containing protein [Compostibacter hankyongensis]|uniref:Heparinase II/III-like C-terminal domain-containing protein n=1 Tax=Compostibacter hankyongensis TaxID=1007089 RepID=A0ABP8FD51_9BACT